MNNPVLSRADILCLTETNIYRNQIGLYERENWKMEFLELCPAKTCHELLVYYNSTTTVVNCKKVFLPHKEQLYLKFALETFPSSIYLLYRSPSSLPTHFIEDISDLVSMEPPDILLGDFNINISSSHYKKLTEKLSVYNQIVSSPTHISGSTLDLVFIKKRCPQPEVTIFPTYFSDHSCVHLVFKL